MLVWVSVPPRTPLMASTSVRADSFSKNSMPTVEDWRMLDCEQLVVGLEQHRGSKENTCDTNRRMVKNNKSTGNPEG